MPEALSRLPPPAARRRALLLGGLSLGALVLAETFKPRQLLAHSRAPYDYETLVPQHFGEWTQLPLQQGQIVDPGLAETLSRFYSQTVTRAYLDEAQTLVMLSLAYGEVQSDAMRVHLPEVCYTAQGFDVTSLGERPLQLGATAIPLSLAAAVQGQREEMIAYFVRVGESVVGRGMRRKLAQMEYSLHGLIPDGLLVRVSSFNHHVESAFGLHQRFITQLFDATGPLPRQAIFGRASA